MVDLKGNYVAAKEVTLIVKIGYDAVVKLCGEGEIEGARKIGKGWAIPKTSIDELASKFGRYEAPSVDKKVKRGSYLSLEQVSRVTGTNVPALRQQCKLGMVLSRKEGDGDFEVQSPRGVSEAMKARSSWYKYNYPDGMPLEEDEG